MTLFHSQTRRHMINLVSACKILSTCSQDFERKRNYDRRNDTQNDGQPKSSLSAAINMF